MSSTARRYEEIPLSKLHPHPDHLPVGFGDDPLDQALIESLQACGVLHVLMVAEREDGDYLIVDGYRRYLAAKALNLPKVPCVVRARLTKGDYERLRWDLHETVKPWTQADFQRWWKHVRQLIES